MKNLLALLSAIALACTLNAGDIITATVVVTTPANLNGTNAASLTISSDTRIATNSVVTPSTQWRASQTASTAAFNLLQHLRSYPFSGIATTATNNGVVLIGADGAALSITISNSWATVAYRTNTVGTAIVMRAPRSIESATTRAIGDDRIIDGINNAPTNVVSASAASMANFVDTSEVQTVAGAKTFTDTGNIFKGKYLELALASQTAHSATTNFAVDFSGEGYRTITAGSAINFVHSTNRVAERSTVIFVYPGGADRALSVNASWHPVSAINATLTNNTIGILSLTVNGTTETNVFYSYAVAQ